MCKQPGRVGFFGVLVCGVCENRDVFNHPYHCAAVWLKDGAIYLLSLAVRVFARRRKGGAGGEGVLFYVVFYVSARRRHAGSKCSATIW